MKIQTLKSYFVLALTGVVILAAMVLVVLQWGNSAPFSFYGKNYPNESAGGVPLILLMLACLVAGPILLWLGRAMFAAALDIHKSRRAAEESRQQVSSAVQEQMRLNNPDTSGPTT